MCDMFKLGFGGTLAITMLIAVVLIACLVAGSALSGLF